MHKRTNRFMSRSIFFINTLSVFLIITTASIRPAIAETSDSVASRYLLATNLANSYSPGNEISVFQLSASALYDYEQIWAHSAPDPLRFKVELNAGVASASDRHNRAIVSANMLALYFVDTLATTVLTPYVEAGIGVIYTDYQVKDQGLRINFNPQVGIGTEIHLDNSAKYFIATRLHHISNGGLHHDNRGINSVLLQFGRFF